MYEIFVISTATNNQSFPNNHHYFHNNNCIFYFKSTLQIVQWVLFLKLLDCSILCASLVTLNKGVITLYDKLTCR